jgi:hypothetical protein
VYLPPLSVPVPTVVHGHIHNQENSSQLTTYDRHFGGITTDVSAVLRSLQPQELQQFCRHLPDKGELRTLVMNPDSILLVTNHCPVWLLEVAHKHWSWVSLAFSPLKVKDWGRGSDPRSVPKGKFTPEHCIYVHWCVVFTDKEVVQTFLHRVPPTGQVKRGTKSPVLPPVLYRSEWMSGWPGPLWYLTFCSIPPQSCDNQRHCPVNKCLCGTVCMSVYALFVSFICSVVTALTFLKIKPINLMQRYFRLHLQSNYNSTE